MLTTIPRNEIENRIKEIESDKNAPLLASKRLNSAHTITLNTKAWFESSDKYWDRKTKKDYTFPISIDKKYLSRALLIVDSLVKLLEYRGHQFKIDQNGHNVVLMSGREITMSLRNVGKYQDNNNGSYNSRDFVFTENLCIQIYEDSWNRKEWKDTPYVPLEEKIVRVVAYSELYSEYSKQYHLDLEEKWRQQDIIRQVEIEKKKEIEREQKEIENLKTTAKNFDEAKKIENYLQERKEYLIRNNLFTQEEKDYYEWGMKQYQILNPLLNMKKDD
ncbi:MAG: hypothetical protein ACN6N7_08975 [Chryseobacterium culicis]